MEVLPGLPEIESIAAVVNSLVPPTPQYSWPLLNLRAGCELWVKHENHTPIGSFKIRGAVAYLSRLRESQPSLRGLVLATRGNHGQAVAFAAQRFGFHATIVVPRGNSVEKNQAMRALGGEIVEAGNDFQSSFEHAQELSIQKGLHFVPSFHHDLVLGNAVSALAFLQASPALARVYVPIGLGSGICAMLAARNVLGRSTEIVGVAAAGAPAIAMSFKAGTLETYPATTSIADGLACSTPNPCALQHILRGVKRIVTVTDEAIEEAMRAYFVDTHNVAEGSAGAALAAVLGELPVNSGQRVGVVLTGGNVDAAVFQKILAASPKGRH